MTKHVLPYTLYIVSLLVLLGGTSCEKDNTPPVLQNYLTVTTDIGQPGTDSVLIVKDYPDTVTLTFSEAIQKNSLTGQITLKAYQQSGQPPVILTPEVHISGEHPEVVTINLEPTAQPALLTLYEINISPEVTGINGARPQTTLRSFFAAGSKSGHENLSAAGTKTNTIIISDLHLSDQRSLDNGYSWFKSNKASLEAFLDHLHTHRQGIRTLVIAGDMLEEWVAPMDVLPFADENGKQLTQHQYAGRILKANQSIVDRLISLHNAGIEIVYVPGNHDMLVTTEDFDTYFGKGVIKQARDASGLGRYEPSEDIIVEHGHRYDYFSSPAPLSNKGLDEVNESSILPPGFFVSRIACSSDKETRKAMQSNPVAITRSQDTDASNWEELSVAWKLIRWTKPVTGSLIRTGIDGYTKDYSIEQIAGWDHTANKKADLYQESYTQEGWTKRMQHNEVTHSEKLPFTSALLAGEVGSLFGRFADEQYIGGRENPKRIVVFGHTHQAMITTISNSVYANSGTWVDVAWPERTFVMLTDMTGSGGEGYKAVSVFNFNSKEDIRKLGETRLLFYTQR